MGSFASNHKFNTHRKKGICPDLRKQERWTQPRRRPGSSQNDLVFSSMLHNRLCRLTSAEG
jgi:hypothetical protein